MKFIIKKICLTCFLILLVVGCGSTNSNDITNTNEETVKSDIKIEEIDWKLNESVENSNSYVVLELENKSKFNFTNIEIVFTEKKNLSEKEKDAFYAAFKKSQIAQGSDADHMDKYIQSRKDLNQSLSMYCRNDDEISIGGYVKDTKCYYFGGSSSKNVVFNDFFRPEKIIIKYMDNDIEKEIEYNFIDKKYIIK